MDKDVEIVKDFIMMINCVLFVEFKIDLFYIIVNDGQEYYVLVKEVDLNVDYKYIIVFKFDLGVYLVVQVVKFDELQLVFVKVNIFFDGIYMGEIYFDFMIMDDMFLLSFGKDLNILVK